MRRATETLSKWWNNPKPSMWKQAFDKMMGEPDKQIERYKQLEEMMDKKFDQDVENMNKRSYKAFNLMEESQNRDLDTMGYIMKAKMPSVDEKILDVRKQFDEQSGEDKPTPTPEQMKEMFAKPEAKVAMEQNEKLKEAHEQFTAADKDLNKSKSIYEGYRKAAFEDIDKLVAQAKEETFEYPTERYSPEEMKECFNEASKIIATIPDARERERLMEIFDMETYATLIEYQSEVATAKMNFGLHKVFQEIKEMHTPKEEVETPTKAKPTAPQDLYTTLKFSSTDLLLNMESLRKLPPIFKAVVESPNVPAEFRKKYHGLDTRINKLTSKQKKAVCQMIAKYVDPKTGVIPAVKLILVVGEMLTHKPKPKGNNKE